MKVTGDQAKWSRRKTARSMYVAAILAAMALFVSPVGAASLGVMEAGEGFTLVEADTNASETSPLENDNSGQGAESTSEGDRTEDNASAEAVSSFLATSSITETEIFLGMYTSASLQITADEIGQVEAWLKNNGIETRVAIAGTFMDIEFPNPDWNIPHDLDGAWDQGAVPFVNLAVGTAGLGPRTAQDVADGVIDEAIRQWARIFADWSQGGAKRAFIAPLQEMNANWVSYGLDPENYKAAYTRIQGIFAEEGVPGEAVLWVFAPNGWSEPGQEFERYYPGDEVVDVVGFSAFNFGACVASGEGWDSYEEAIEPYMERMERMAPEKPIFLAQTGTVEVGGDKGEWLVDTFQKLSEVGNFRGLIYFNVSKQEAGAPSCNPVDWRVYNPEEGSGDGGFIEAILALGGGAAPLPSNQVFIPMVVQ